jgi:hypothetical protein
MEKPPWDGCLDVEASDGPGTSPVDAAMDLSPHDYAGRPESLSPVRWYPDDCHGADARR